MPRRPRPRPPRRRPRPAEGDATALERLLARRSRALQAGRPKAYAATATGPQRLVDREVARNAAPLRLRDVELAVDSADVRGRRARLQVRSIYGVRGVRGTFTSARRLTAVRTRQRLARAGGDEPPRAPSLGGRADRRAPLPPFRRDRPGRARDRGGGPARGARDRLRADGGGAAPAAAAAALSRGRRGRRRAPPARSRGASAASRASRRSRTPRCARRARRSG